MAGSHAKGVLTLWLLALPSYLCGYMDEIRVSIMAVLSMMLAFFAPIKNVMELFVLIFFVDFICGLVADVHNGGEWNTKKALQFLNYAFIIFGTAAFVFVSGHLLGERTAALQCVSGLAYLTFYAFGVNILKNLRRIVTHGPALMVLNFMWYVLTIKFVTMIPYFKDWQTAVKKEQDTENDGEDDTAMTKQEKI